MIKVLNVVIDNHIGGIQNRILDVGKKLEKSDISTIIVSPKGEGSFSEKSRLLNFKVYQASIQSPKLLNSVKNILRNFFWILNIPFGIIEVINIIKKENIDIVHVNGLLAVHAAIAAKLSNKPLVWHLISTFYPKNLILILRPFFIFLSDKIILITNNTKQYYFGTKWNTSKFKVIFEPVDIDYFKNNYSLDMKKEIQEKISVSPDISIIGFIGNISPQKNLETFIYLAKKVTSNSESQYKFLIVGDATQNHKEYLHHLLKLRSELNLENDVLFTGKVLDIREFLSIMDIFLMTSISEGTPLVILEAMAMEVPVVAPDVGGISEQIENGKTGLIFSPDNINMVSEIIIQYNKNKEPFKKMGEMGRKRVEQYYSLERCVESHKTLYNEILEKARCKY
jgi:glycosyltransferase involved in cell wall biosynthesis